MQKPDTTGTPMPATSTDPARPPGLQQLCPDCLQALAAQSTSAKPNAIGSIQWCGHRGVHGLLFRDKLILVPAATPEQAGTLDRAYMESVSQLLQFERALLEALSTDRPAH